MKTRNTIVAAVLLAATSAMATVSLPFNTTLYNPATGTTPYYNQTGDAWPGWFSGGNIVATLSSSLVPSGDGGPLGTFYSTVYQNGVGGNLGFDYWVSIASDSPAILTKSTLAGWGWSWVTISDAGTGASGVSQAAGAPSWTDGDPTYFYRNPQSLGGTLEIAFRDSGKGTYLQGNGIAADDYSSHFYFVTDATTWGYSTAGNIDGGVTSQAAIIVPTPEPGMLARAGLLGLGLLGFWSYRRNKK